MSEGLIANFQILGLILLALIAAIAIVMLINLITGILRFYKELNDNKQQNRRMLYVTDFDKCYQIAERN